MIEGSVVTGYTGSATEVVIPEGVTEIGKYAFQSNEAITSVTLPESVTAIDESAFRFCRSLSSVSMPGVRSTGYQAFEYTALTEVNAPELVTLGERTFRSCGSLTSISMPKVQFIGSMALASTALEDVVIPESVTEFGEEILSAVSPGKVYISLSTLLTATFDDNAFGSTFINQPDGMFVITGVDCDVTILPSGIHAGEKTVEFSGQQTSETLFGFRVLEVSTDEESQGISVTNESGREVSVDGEPVLTGSVKPVDSTSDAYLYKLSIAEGVALSPTFSNQETSYVAEVEYLVDEVTVAAIPSDEDGASVKINGTLVTREGDWSTTVPLEQGENSIAVAVTSADGAISKTYSLVVTKKPQPQNITIGSADELLEFAADINNGVYTGATDCTVTLTADINLSGVEWTPMGWDGMNYFSGVFDGAGHSITNMSIVRDSSWTNAGLFGVTDGDIRNLTVSGSITNDISNRSVNLGMIAGFCLGSELTSCVAEGTISGSAAMAQCVGGVVGYVEDATMTDCASLVSITVPNAFYVGGVTGAVVDAQVIDCSNEGAIAITNANACAVGGVVGTFQTSQASCLVSHCVNSGNVTIEKRVGWGYAGGIVGKAAGEGTIECCANAATISGPLSSLGGIVGYSHDDFDDVSIDSCLNTGKVSNDWESGVAGGIVGDILCPDGMSALSSCISMGAVGGGMAHGPIAGNVAGETGESFSNNHHLSSITSSEGVPTCGSTPFEELTQEILDAINRAGGNFCLTEDGQVVVCPYTYALTIDYGYDGKTEAGAYPKGTVVELDAGTRAGYTFAGWTLSGGGSLANASAAKTALTMPAANVIVTATWKANPYVPPADPTYPVDTGEAENGDVTVTPSRPHEGDEVTVAPEPDEGFEVGSVEVTDKDGEPVEVTDNGDGTWSFVMPAGGATVTVTFACDGGALCPSAGLADVDKDAWYHGPVDWAVSTGAITGYGDGGTFGPADPVSRAQMATVLWRLAGEPESEGALPADCDASSFYATAVSWALGSGTFSGYADGSFGPADSLTREQAAVVLWARAGRPASDADLSAFADGGDVSEFAEGAMRWAVSEGVLSGTAEGLLEPGRAVTRAELAALLMRMEAAKA